MGRIRSDQRSREVCGNEETRLCSTAVVGVRSCHEVCRYKVIVHGRQRDPSLRTGRRVRRLLPPACQKAIASLARNHGGSVQYGEGLSEFPHNRYYVRIITRYSWRVDISRKLNVRGSYVGRHPAG